MKVMDADLQHDPEYIPKISEPIRSGSADFVMGSRNVTGGKVEDWPLHRRIISWGATNMAKPLTSAGDPMSGFFSIHKKTFNQGKKIFYKIFFLFTTQIKIIYSKGIKSNGI